MSDHPHHLLSHNEGKLEKFFEYFDGQVARALNRFHGRRHQVWSRRYSAIPVLDEQTDIARLVYFLTNPQKADLVDKIEQWPGLSSVRLYLGDNDGDNEFLFFDRTAWQEATTQLITFAGEPPFYEPLYSLELRINGGGSEKKAKEIRQLCGSNRYWPAWRRDKPSRSGGDSSQRGWDGTIYG